MVHGKEKIPQVRFGTLTFLAAGLWAGCLTTHNRGATRVWQHLLR